MRSGERGLSPLNFNPRSREGSDWEPEQAGGRLPSISIHAPARGATGLHCEPDTVKDISIHAPARGATQKLIDKISGQAFQSTLPRGERRGSTEEREVKGIFQSTLPRGERPISVSPHGDSESFQSTLPRGERLQFYLKFTLCF